MKELTKFQAIIYNLGGVLMLLGAIMPIEPSLTNYAAYIYTCGALAFGCMKVNAIAPFRGDEWQVALCIAAFIELYTAFRIPAEIKKENESGEFD